MIILCKDIIADNMYISVLVWTAAVSSLWMKQECVNRRKCCLSVCCENNETSRTPASSSVNTVRPRLIVIGENHAQDLTGKGRSSCIGPSDQRGGFTVIHIQLVFSLCDGGMGWKGAGTFHCELYSIMYIVFSFSKKTFRIVLKKIHRLHFHRPFWEWCRVIVKSGLMLSRLLLNAGLFSTSSSSFPWLIAENREHACPPVVRATVLRKKSWIPMFVLVWLNDKLSPTRCRKYKYAHFCPKYRTV